MKSSVVWLVCYILFPLLLILPTGCTNIKVLRSLKNPDYFIPDTDSKYALKIHLKDGGLYVLQNHILSADKDTLFGQGDYFNPNRKKISETVVHTDLLLQRKEVFTIPLSSVALIETNTVEGQSGKVLAMGLVGVPTVAITAYCLSNPKACFGSCPTFYAWNGEKMKLMAEGFSSSILRAYEKSDIDMLFWSKSRGSDFTLQLTNEALETHVIRYADLLVFPKKDQERIFATENGQFFKTDRITSPVSCIGPEGDLRDLVLRMDGQDRYSEADSKNLAAREEVEVEFNGSADQSLGLIIGSRQTLMTTYLFYQGLAYLGNTNGYFASRIESGDQGLKRRVDRVWDLLGGIEVFLQNPSGRWSKIAEIEEMGPIASDVHLIRLPARMSDNIRIRLRMTKGLWRIDYLALAEAIAPVEPVRIKPSLVLKDNQIDDYTLALLNDSIEPLITLPGDSYTLHYTLPGLNEDYEVYLKSKGYYLEWLRESWMAEKDLKKAFLLFGMPKLFLRRMADDFKAVEPVMEDNFWRSRYVKN